MRVSLWGALSAGAIASLFAISAAADSIRIGLISEITGPNAEAKIFAAAYRAKYNLEWKGVEGNYTFDENGDGLRGYNIVKNKGGKVKFVEHINVGK